MRKLSVFALAVLFFSSEACKETPDCSKLKNGKFFYYPKGSRSKVLVERKDSLQTEFDTQDSSTFRNKIIWTDECSFDLYLNAYSKTKLDEVDSLFAAIPARVNIIHVNDEYYICDIEMKTTTKVIELRDTIYFQK